MLYIKTITFEIYRHVLPRSWCRVLTTCNKNYLQWITGLSKLSFMDIILNLSMNIVMKDWQSITDNKVVIKPGTCTLFNIYVPGKFKLWKVYGTYFITGNYFCGRVCNIKETIDPLWVKYKFKSVEGPWFVLVTEIILVCTVC